MLPFRNGIDVDIISPKIARNILFLGASAHELTVNPEMDCGSLIEAENRPESQSLDTKGGKGCHRAGSW